jgi:hypothetical protein
MSWVSVESVFGSFSVSGFDAGDGKLTLIAALVAAVLVYAAHHQPGRRQLKLGFAVVASLAIAGTGIYDTLNVSNKAGDVNSSGFASAHVGIGLWLVDIAALTMLVAISKFFSRQKTHTPRAAVAGVAMPATSDNAMQHIHTGNVTAVVPPAAVSAQRIREWAIASGLEIKAQGPIPRHIRDRYLTNVQA